MWKRLKNLFKKSEARTLKEAGDLVEAGWSPDTPTKQDAAGNITHRCAETALASVHRGHPGAWARLRTAMKPIAAQASSMGGILVPGLVNCQEDMTKGKVVGAFRKAEAEARAART